MLTGFGTFPNGLVKGPDGALYTSNRGISFQPGDGSVLRITRMLTDTPAAGLRVAAWSRRAGDGQWLRWQSAPVRSHHAWLDAWDAAARWAQNGAPPGPQPGGAQAVALLAALDWQLHYYRANAWINPLSSASAGLGDTHALPDGVRLMITLAPGQSLAGPMVVDWVRPDFGGRR